MNKPLGFDVETFADHFFEEMELFLMRAEYELTFKREERIENYE